MIHPSKNLLESTDAAEQQHHDSQIKTLSPMKRRRSTMTLRKRKARPTLAHTNKLLKAALRVWELRQRTL
jgi:hypothetical protein